MGGRVCGEETAVREIGVARVGHAPADGPYRVLVDRLWPRGIRKVGAPWDEWLKDVAPSTELRRWYGHDPSRYEVFRQRYGAELASAIDTPAMRRLFDLARGRPLVLLTATADLERSHVRTLAAFLEERLRRDEGA